MKVYIVFWGDSFGDWKLVKVFSTKEKAEKYLDVISGKGFWIYEQELE
jgi:hypothetical protein